MLQQKSKLIKDMPALPSKILFVINKGAGRKRGVDWEGIISAYFENAPCQIRFMIMPLKEALRKLKESIEEFDPALVVAVGGDGTVSFVANELLGRNIRMAIIPAGSANGLAKELGIPEDPEAALRVMEEGEVKNTDVILLNDTGVCLHLSDLGLNARLVKYFQQTNIRGKIGYVLALLKALYRSQPIRVTVQSDQADVERSAIMVLIANASKFGTGLTLNPCGNIFDGLFEVVIVSRIGIAEIFKMLLKFQRFNPQNIEVLSARSATLETTRLTDFQIDGEYMGKVDRVVARVLPGKLRLLVPREPEG
jgi:diacylglycerol kinase (ATP)